MTPWTVAHQVLLSNWSGLPCSLPGDLPNTGIELRSLILQDDSLLSEPPGKLKITGVGGWLIPSPGDLPNPRIEPGLLHCRLILYQLSYQGSFPDGPYGKEFLCYSPTNWISLATSIAFNSLLINRLSMWVWSKKEAPSELRGMLLGWWEEMS